MDMMTTGEQEPITALARIKTEAIHLATALHTIASEAQEGEMVRIAVAALQSTAVGRDYLIANPLQY